jgi:hypothetical protein
MRRHSTPPARELLVDRVPQQEEIHVREHPALTSRPPARLDVHAPTI